MYSLTTSLIFSILFINNTDTLAEPLVTNQSQNVALKSADQLTLMHGVKFHNTIDISQYYVSEKLDGVRAYWDGKLLWSRQGILIQAPHSLTSELPAVPLDGELWLGRGRFEEVAALIQRNDPTHPAWDQISFAVFDVPYLTGAFTDRYAALKHLLLSPTTTSLVNPVFAIHQFNVASETELFEMFDAVVAQGGEGLILHKKSNTYQFGRTENVLKLKPENITRAKVIGYKPGNGKYQGMVGSIKVITPSGTEFYVGSGLTDAMRLNPPAINSSLCVLHTGFTSKNIPRFPRYTQFCNSR